MNGLSLLTREDQPPYCQRSGEPRTSSMMAGRRRFPNNKRVASPPFGTQGTASFVIFLRKIDQECPGIQFTPRLLLAFLVYEGASCLPRQPTIVWPPRITLRLSVSTQAAQWSHLISFTDGALCLPQAKLFKRTILCILSNPPPPTILLRSRHSITPKINVSTRRRRMADNRYGPS